MLRILGKVKTHSNIVIRDFPLATLIRSNILLSRR